jgi:hypothetical protein
MNKYVKGTLSFDPSCNTPVCSFGVLERVLKIRERFAVPFDPQVA